MKVLWYSFNQLQSKLYYVEILWMLSVECQVSNGMRCLNRCEYVCLSPKFKSNTNADSKQAICSYLEQCTPYLHPSLLHSLQASLAQDNTFPSQLRVRELVSRRLNEITNMAKPQTALGKRKRGSAPMPDSARLFLEQMGCGSQGSMDIDEGWKTHVIGELKDSFLRYASP